MNYATNPKSKSLKIFNVEIERKFESNHQIPRTSYHHLQTNDALYATLDTDHFGF